MPPRRRQSPRERAARALCRNAGNPEDTMFAGRPMWMSYLDEVDLVLRAALDEPDWLRIRQRDIDPDGSA